MTNLRKVQIRTNAKNFKNHGVYMLDADVYGHYREDHGDSFTCQLGYEWTLDHSHHTVRYMRKAGKFVNQTEFSHGTMELDQKEAVELTKKLNDNARNSWVRLYYMD